MYKVFFENRIVYLTDDFASAFKYNYGLFYKFYDSHELKELIKLFGYLTKIKKLFIVHHDLDHLLERFSSLFKVVEAAGGIVRSSTGKVLVINRRGKWDLPKGKIDDGETIEKTALREVSEETGLQNLTLGKKITDTYHTYLLNGQPVLKKTTWYEMTYDGDEHAAIPQQEEEITEVLWLIPEDVTMILGNTYLSIIDVLREADLLPF
jgi:8-oxo-dGTP pyrophosphatase MutT (NUDIX family)